MTAYTAVIMAEERGGRFRNVVAVYDDEAQRLAAGSFALPPVPDAPPEGTIYDPWEPLESSAEQVLAAYGWRVTESWNSNPAGLGSYASAERI
jgi:hypothetical protein